MKIIIKFVKSRYLRLPIINPALKAHPPYCPADQRWKILLTFDSKKGNFILGEGYNFTALCSKKLQKVVFAWIIDQWIQQEISKLKNCH